MTDTNYRNQIIDIYLLYWGRVQRKDLIRHLGIGNVTATRAFSDYGTKNPKSLFIDPSKKAYVYIEGFKPLSLPSPEDILPLMAYGREQKQLALSCFGPKPTHSVTAALCPLKVSAITRAMVSKSGIEISYISGTSGISERCVYPHSVFTGGGVWYFRGYDSKSKSYRTFRFSRIESVGIEKPSLGILKSVIDEEWSMSVTLTLAPHSKHPQKDALAMDLGLKDRPVSNIDTNRVMAGFVLIDLRVDCSVDARLNPFEYHLQLMNRHELSEIESLNIAPGFIVYDSSFESSH